MSVALQKTKEQWSSVSKLFSVPHKPTEYNRLVRILDELIDEVGENENHPLAGLMETLSVLIENYENDNAKISEGSAVNTLNHLMNEHGLSQKDLTDIGSQGVVSEILNNKRELNLRQIRLLANRFNLSPAVFIC